MTPTDRHGRTYHAALTRYDQRRDPVDHVIDKVLPADLGIVHAHVRPMHHARRPLTEPHFLDGLYVNEAICGATIKVVLPVALDLGDPDACQRCVGEILRMEARYNNQ